MDQIVNDNKLNQINDKCKKEIYYEAMRRRYFDDSMLIKNYFNYKKVDPQITRLIKYLSINAMFVISGGFTTALMFGMPIRPESDIDLWCLNYGSARLLLKPLYNWIIKNYTVVEVSSIAAGILNIVVKEFPNPIQIIFINETSVSGIIGDFDFSHNKSAIYMGNTYTTYDAINSFIPFDKSSKNIHTTSEIVMGGRLKTTLYKETSMARIDKALLMGCEIANLFEFYSNEELQKLRKFIYDRNKSTKCTIKDFAKEIPFVSFKTNPYVHRALPKLRITLKNYKDYNYYIDSCNNLSIIWGNGKIKRCEIREIYKGCIEYGAYFKPDNRLDDLQEITNYIGNKLMKTEKYKYFDYDEDRITVNTPADRYEARNKIGDSKYDYQILTYFVNEKKKNDIKDNLIIRHMIINEELRDKEYYAKLRGYELRAADGHKPPIENDLLGEEDKPKVAIKMAVAEPITKTSIITESDYESGSD